jgi:hypothetical protein
LALEFRNGSEKRFVKERVLKEKFLKETSFGALMARRIKGGRLYIPSGRAVSCEQ